MMKTLFSFLFVCMFLLGFGQNNKTIIWCNNMQKEDSILYKKLISEKKIINYNGLAKKIIKDFYLTKLSKQNLIFIFNERYVRSAFDEEPCICCFERLSINPNYSDTVFWTKKNILSMVKKFRKNIIPRDDLRSEFISNKITKESTTIFKKLVCDTRNQSEGKYLEMYNGKKEEEHNFFYFPYNKKEKLILENDKGKHIRNYDELHLDFTNDLFGIVSVKFTYNEKDIIIKTYQYQKNWVEIPTKKEYEF